MENNLNHYLIDLIHMLSLVEHIMVILVPLWGMRYWILVVHSQLLPHLDVPSSQDGDNHTKPEMQEHDGKNILQILT